ncbi:MAG: transporter [Syntrophales bacterium]
MLQDLKFKRGLWFCGLLLCFILFAVGLPADAHAAHPLITDDTGTVGKGKFQFEFGGEYTHEDEDGVKEDETIIVPVLSYGLRDNIDLEFCFPYQYMRATEEGLTTTEDGISDIEIDLKWRFYEKGSLSFAIRPLISLPTGDNEKGLGTGEVGGSLLFYVTKELEPWAFHLNLGYGRNENKFDERKDIWHASLASEVEVAKGLKLVANIGVETNSDESSDTHPAFILGGLIYSLSEDLDIDFGVKGGLNKTEADYSILAGITMRF